MIKFFSTASLIVISILVAQSAYAGTLSCSITTALGCSGTPILRMSGTTGTNAHAELGSGTNGNYDDKVVCCTGVTGLSNSCASAATSSLLWLAGSTNAHSAQTQTNANYTNNACLGVGSGGSVLVGYQDSNCTGYDTTVASISSSTNAHIATSTVYTRKVCASATSSAGLTASATLASSLFDSTLTGGAGYNSIMWDGNLGGPGFDQGKVQFQFATSNSINGPWIYYGPACVGGASDWFDAPTKLTPVELKSASCSSVWNNKQYYRYKIQLCSNNCSTGGTYTPTVTKVVVNWVP